MAMKRRDREDKGAPGGQLEPGCDFYRRYPNLWEFLCLLQFEDGSERELGTLMLCVGDGRARGWLNDRAQGLSAWLSADSLGHLLDALDEALLEDTIEWRVAKPHPGYGRKK